MYSGAADDVDAPAGPRRQARALRNDEVILEFATQIADQEGWSGLPVAAVAERAQVSRQAVISRYKSRPGIATALWQQRLGSVLQQNLEHVIAACPSPTHGFDAAHLHAAMFPFMEPDQSMRAAAEILLASRYEPQTAAAVAATTGEALTAWLAPVGRRVTRAQAARRLYVVAMALGLLLEARRSPVRTVEMNREINRHAEAMTVASKGRPLPDVSARQLDGPNDFGTGDPLWEALLQATLDEVGQRGYEAATIEVISRAAGCTSGAVFARYGSKLELFVDASQRNLSRAGRINQRFEAALDERYGAGIGHAVGLREVMAKQRFGIRSVGLEQHRLTWHDEQLRASWAAATADMVWRIHDSDSSLSRERAHARARMWVTIPMGIAVIADLCPHAQRLPLDVVTVPIAAEMSTQFGVAAEQ